VWSIAGARYRGALKTGAAPARGAGTWIDGPASLVAGHYQPLADNVLIARTSDQTCLLQSIQKAKRNGPDGTEPLRFDHWRVEANVTDFIVLLLP